MGEPDNNLKAVVVDERLAGFTTDGTYLAISKKVGGMWKLLRIVGDFSRWHDMDYNLSEFVRGHARFDSREWSSGLYRIEIKNDKWQLPRNYKKVFKFSIDSETGRL